VEHKFGSDDYRLVLTELIVLRQIGTVEDYATLPALFEGSSGKKRRLCHNFEASLFQVCMRNNKYDGLFFVSRLIE
jgi:hypothetical protein